MTRRELLNKLNRLKKGLPTDLVYINRIIDNKHVQVPHGYNVSTIDEFIEKDIQSVLSLGGSIIRPVLGMFGSGKSTILNRTEQIIPLIISNDKYLPIRINLENVPIVQHQEFIKAIMKQVFPIIQTEQFKKMYIQCNDEELIEIFKGYEILKNIRNLFSSSATDRIPSKAYFLDEIEEDKIFQVIEGVIQLAKKYNKTVVILVDELESLIKSDEKGILTEIIVSRFLRGIIDRHDTSVYIIFTCYKDAYDTLKDNFYKFYRISEGNEIKLGDFSDEEKEELTKKILEEAMEYTFGKLSVKDILLKLKETLDYYVGNLVKLISNEIYQYIDQFKEISKQVQELYEKDARKDIALPLLLEWGFKPANISEAPEKIAGFNFDIFASASERNRIVQRVFGEIKSVTCNKKWAEDFINWINIQIYTKSGEYAKNRDKLLFIAPDYTLEASKLLEENDVKPIKYHNPAVENILKSVEEKKYEGLTKKEKAVIDYINQTKSKCRTYDVLIRDFSKELLESLVNKKKLIIRKGKTIRLCLKK